VDFVREIQLDKSLIYYYYSNIQFIYVIKNPQSHVILKRENKRMSAMGIIGTETEVGFRSTADENGRTKEAIHKHMETPKTNNKHYCSYPRARQLTVLLILQLGTMAEPGSKTCDVKAL
jgi:hypothetical protein